MNADSKTKTTPLVVSGSWIGVNRRLSASKVCLAVFEMSSTYVAAAAIASFVLTVILTADARAQSYPVKAVRIIVPVAPGGGTDPQARLLGRKFQESMGQTFVVENRTGAASMVGTEFVVRSPADGYTLLCAASTLAGANSLRKDLSFDLLKDLAPVG